MKRLSFKIATLMLATVFALSSCVKNEVSDEVKALRAAQLDMVSAKVKLTEAQTTYQLALAANQDAMSAQIQANTAQMAQDLAQDASRFEQELKQLVAATDVAVEQAKADMKLAEVALQNAINAMANAVAQLEADELDRAQMYLGEYKKYMGEVTAYSNDKLDAEAELAVLAAIKAASLSGIIIEGGVAQEYLEYTKKYELAKAEAELAALNASLTAYAAITANPTSIQAEIDAINVQIQNLQVQLSAKDVEARETLEDVELLLVAQARLKWIEASYDQSVAEIEAAQAIIDANNESIEVLNDHEKGTATQTKSSYNSLLNAYDAAVDGSPEQAEALGKIRALFEFGSLYAEIVDNYPGEAEQLYTWSENNILNKAKVDAAIDELIAAINAKIAEIQGDVADAEYDKARATANKTALQTYYNTLYTDLAKIEDDLSAAVRINKLAEFEVDKLEIQIAALEGIRDDVQEVNLDAIEGLLDFTNEAIAAKKDAITLLKAEILEGGYILDSAIAKVTAEIAELTGKIADSQALANKYKALLDAIIG